MAAVQSNPSLPNMLRDRQAVLFLGYQFFAHLEFFNGLYVVYLITRGVSPGLINLLVCPTTMTRVVAEAPSGYLGDRFGDRPMLIVGTVLMALFALGLPWGTSPWLLFPLFVLHGLSIASTSGADDGLLYRTVTRGDDAALEKMRPLSTALNHLALGVAAAAGGVMVQHGGWPLALRSFAACALVALVFLLGIRGPSVISRAEASEATGLRSILATLRQHHALTAMIVLFAALEGCANVLFVYAQFRANDLGLGLVALGLAMGTVEAASAAGASLSTYVNVGGRGFTLSLAILVAALGAAPLSGSVLFVASFLLYILVATLLKILAETYLVTQVPTELTSTSLSLFSLLVSAFTGAIHLLFATLGDALSHVQQMAILVLITLTSSLGLIILTRGSWHATVKSASLQR